MKIFDEGIFINHLDSEIAKSERFGYPFAVLIVKTLNPQSHAIMLLTSIIEANYRTSDVVSRIDDGTYYILLNGTDEDAACLYMARLVQKVVSENEVPLASAVTSYRTGDTREILMKRLIQKL
ncbi:hypothetical protein [Bacillus toyonensis]|uniref:hypothetical protein n=1 Tax=Bacillus toyonensis TaxID=155322 RepID=UPI002E1B7270|nr:hypothetical protein [Bacillus toyonensis]